MDFPPKKLHVMRESAGVIVVRDTDTWEPVFSLPERESDISSLLWSPDGHMIA